MRILDSTLNRFVQCDGKSITYSSYVPNLLYLGLSPKDIEVLQLDEDVNEFNRLSNDQLCLGEDVNLPGPGDWMIPEHFKKIDIEALVCERFKLLVAPGKSQKYLLAAVSRIVQELTEWKNRNLLDLLRTLHYVVTTFEEKNLTWGVGRGSSCASYVLFILGLHKVDSIKYDISLSEFFRD